MGGCRPPICVNRLSITPAMATHHRQRPSDAAIVVITARPRAGLHYSVFETSPNLDHPIETSRRSKVGVITECVMMENKGLSLESTSKAQQIAHHQLGEGGGLQNGLNRTLFLKFRFAAKS